MKGPHKPESIEKMRQNRKGKCLGDKNPMFGVHRYGEANPNYGRKHTSEEIEIMSINRKGKHAGEDHYNWKGDDTKYASLHQWVRKYRPRTEMCEICHIRKATEVACVTHIYEHNIDNFRWSCHSCNQKSDAMRKKMGGMLVWNNKYFKTYREIISDK